MTQTADDVRKWWWREFLTWWNLFRLSRVGFALHCYQTHRREVAGHGHRFAVVCAAIAFWQGPYFARSADPHRAAWRWLTAWMVPAGIVYRSARRQGLSHRRALLDAWRARRMKEVRPGIHIQPGAYAYDTKCPLCPHRLDVHGSDGCCYGRDVRPVGASDVAFKDLVGVHPESCSCPVAVDLPGGMPHLIRALDRTADVYAWARFQHKRRRRFARALWRARRALRDLIPVVRQTADAFGDAAKAAEEFYTTLTTRHRWRGQDGFCRCPAHDRLVLRIPRIVWHRLFGHDAGPWPWTKEETHGGGLNGPRESKGTGPLHCSCGNTQQYSGRQDPGTGERGFSKTAFVLFPWLDAHRRHFWDGISITSESVPVPLPLPSSGTVGVVTGDNFAIGSETATIPAFAAIVGRTPASRLEGILRTIRLFAWQLPYIWWLCRRNDAARVNRVAGMPVAVAGEKVEYRSAIRRAWQIVSEIRKAWAEAARGTCPVVFRTPYAQALCCVKPAGHDGDCWSGDPSLHQPRDLSGRPLSALRCPKCRGRGDIPETRRMARSFGQEIDRGDAPGEWQDVLEIEERGGGWWWMRRRCRICRGWGTVWAPIEVKGVPYR